MIELERNESAVFKSYLIKTSTGKIDIRFKDNFDLYWSFVPIKNTKENVVYITKENYFLYNLFKNLYDDIVNNNPYTNPCCEDVKLSFVPTNSPYEKDKIIWESDDFKKENTNVLIIEKIDDKYRIEFIRNDEKCGKVIPIRISNSESRYYPFNNIFISMYKKLDEYNFEYHQIDIEEYLYSISS